MRVSRALFFGLLVTSFLISIPQVAQQVAALQSLPTDTISTLERNWTIEIVVVNYDESLIDETTLTSGLPTQRVYYPGFTLEYDIEYHVTHANASYVNSLRQVMMDSSVAGEDLGSELNESALEYHELNLDDPQSIFNPRDGRVIDGYVVEDWLAENPAVPIPDLGYVLYLFNFSEFDSSDHSFEHWYDYHPIDPDTGRPQDFFRLEWDNALNPDVKFQFAGFGGRENLFVVDASADQWYLRWARIWWGETPYDDHPLHCTMDLEDIMAIVDTETPAGITALNEYLRDYIYDPIAYLFVPGQHSPTAYVESGTSRVLVFAMDTDVGVTVESLEWVIDEALHQHDLTELLPFIPWTAEVDFLDIQAPAQNNWETLFWNNAYMDGETTIALGLEMFNDIYDNMRPFYVDTMSPDINVFGVIFIKQQMEMHVYGRTYTGLGGGGQAVCWKSWERYYLPDGVTPKSGISSTQLHETMHAVGFGHAWAYGHYVGDFSYSPMGYFSSHNGTSTFDKNWAQGTYLDQMWLNLWNEFIVESNDLGLDETELTMMADQMAREKFQLADDLYNQMDWIGCYNALLEAEYWFEIMVVSQYDHSPPMILSWNVDPWPVSNTGFTMYISAIDVDSHVESVEVIVSVSGGPDYVYPCTYSGGGWRATVPDYEFTSNTTLSVSANLTDQVFNEINEYLFDYQYVITPATTTTTTEPPQFPIPMEIILLGGFGLVVVLVVVVYAKRR